MGFNSGMMKRALLALAGLFCLGSSLPAQPFFAGGLFDQPSINSPWASLESQDRFMLSTGFGSMRATRAFLLEFNPSQPMSYGYPGPDNKSWTNSSIDMQLRY